MFKLIVDSITDYNYVEVDDAQWNEAIAGNAKLEREKIDEALYYILVDK